MHRLNDPIAPPPFSFFSRMSLPPRTTVLNLYAEEIQELVERRAEGEINPFFDESPSPVTLDLYRHPRSSLPLDLNPRVPIYEIPHGYDFSSGVMEKFCRDHPISIIRGLPEALGINMNLFAMETLAAAHPQMTLKVYTQIKQEKDTNKDEGGVDSWEHLSEGGQGTLINHVRYLQKEEEKEGVATPKRSRKVEKVRFGVGNLSNYPLHFRDQIKELEKLPAIFRYGQSNDLLQLMGFPVEGLTGIYSFLKTAGVRTPAHEEDGGIPSVNISVGPGSSEWFAVEIGYIKKIEEECTRKGIAFGHGSSLWPSKQELEALGIPCYRFSQEKGDLVYTGAGTLHWVQGQDVGGNVAWNSGALSTQVLKHCKWQIGRDRLQRVQSSIPLERTAWKIAKDWKIYDRDLHFDVRGILIRSLANLMMTERFVIDSGVPIAQMNQNEMMKRYNCEDCKIEVLDIVFFTIPANESRCFHCAEANGGIKSHILRRQGPTQHLSDIFDRFRL